MNKSTDSPFATQTEDVEDHRTEVPPRRKRRRRLQFSLAFLLLLCVPIGAWFAFQPNQRHSAAAVLRISAQKPSVLDTEPVDVEEFRRFKRDQMLMIQSRFITEQALTDPQVYSILRTLEDPAAWLAESLEVESEPDSELVWVRIRGKDPAELKVLLDAAVDSYLENHFQGNAVRLQNRLMVLESAYVQRRDEIEVLSEEIESRQCEQRAYEVETMREDLELLRSLLRQLRTKQMLLRLELNPEIEDRVMPIQRATVETE